MTSRRKFLLSAVGAPAVLVGYGVGLEPRWLKLNQVRCPVAGLGKRVRILQLSDLHASKFVPLSRINDAIEIGLQQRPDVICMTGDFINDGGEEYDKADFIRILRRLTAAAPVLGVLGNHDGGAWAAKRRGKPDTSHVREILERAEIDLLHNRSRSLDLRGGRVTFAGVGDLWADEVSAEGAFVGLEGGQEPIVALAHNPDTKDVLASYPWQLMLSGHTHGGQVWIPGYGTPFAPVRDQRYVEGLKQWNERWIQVTVGVGVTAPIRLNCRPEVCLIDLTPATADA